MSDQTVHRLTFHGGRSGVMPLTWGQRWMWEEAAWFGGRHAHLNMSLVIDVPSGCTSGRVLDAIRDLVETHESLRTTFLRDADGAPVQSLARSGDVPVRMVTTCPDRLDEATNTVEQELKRRPFEPGEWPHRAAVVLLDDMPVRIVWILFHLAADGWALDQLSSQATRLLGRPGGPRAAVGAQPFDLVAHETGAAGQRQCDKAMRYWRQQLAGRRVGVGASGTRIPEPRRFRELAMTSPALALAVRHLAVRHEVGEPTVVLALFLAAMTAPVGERGCTIRLYSGNRAGAYGDAALGTFVQDVPVSLSFAEPTFGSIVSATWASSISAHRYGHYDVAAANRLVEETTGSPDPAELSCAVNLAFDATAAMPAERRPSPDTDAEIVDAMGATTVELYREFDRDRRGRRLYFKAYGLPAAIGATLRGDTAFHSPAKLHHLLGTLDALALAAVRNEHVTMAEMAALSVPRPVEQS